MPSTHPAALPIETLVADCDVRRTRRSGPGGQHRNKVETAVVITHRPTGIVAEGSERRSLDQNQKQAIFRLRVKLAIEVREAAGPTLEPSPLWLSRCRNGVIAIHDEHDDFPALLAEAIDFLTAEEMDLRAAADRLGCTSSQLVKLLHKAPQAMSHVNEERSRRGMHRLK